MRIYPQIANADPFHHRYMGNLTTARSINHIFPGHRNTRTRRRKHSKRESARESNTRRGSPENGSNNAGRARARKAKAKIGVLKHHRGHHGARNGHQQIQHGKEEKKRREKQIKKKKKGCFDLEKMQRCRVSRPSLRDGSRAAFSLHICTDKSHITMRKECQAGQHIKSRSP